MTHPGLMGATQSGTLDFLARNSPSEEILAGGAAKVKKYDRQFLDKHISQVGETTARRGGLKLLEADWGCYSGCALLYSTSRASRSSLSMGPYLLARDHQAEVALCHIGSATSPGAYDHQGKSEFGCPAPAVLF
jgi:hypothetical protein